VVIAAACGIAAGLGLARLTMDPHTATAHMLTGTVTASNETSREIQFEADGAAPDPEGDPTLYDVLEAKWQDSTGAVRDGYPACLKSENDDPISLDHHRVKLTVIHRDFGGRQLHNIVVHVQCLD
jgi:hypothetical protein